MGFPKLKLVVGGVMASNNYVSNKQFLKMILEYQDTQDRKLYNEIGKIFLLIAKNLLNKTNFINYTQDRKDEMLSDATYTMCRYIDKFDINKGDNPFAYFTQYAWNSFRMTLNNYKKMDDTFINLSFIENFDNNTDFNGEQY